MWLTDRDAYIHMPKTGGTHSCSAFRDLCGGKLIGGQHDPAFVQDPGVLAARRVVGNIRSPFDWYLSLYIHCRNSDRVRHGFLREYGAGSIEFHDVLYGMTHPAGRSPASYVGVIWEPSDGAARSFVGSGVGLWSWTVRYFYGERSMCETGDGAWLVDVLLNTSKLDEALPMCFGVDTSERMRLNTRHHRQGHYMGPGDYFDWYTADAERWIMEADGEMLSRFGLSTRPQDSDPIGWDMKELPAGPIIRPPGPPPVVGSAGLSCEEV